jgi:hypothetical protein
MSRPGVHHGGGLGRDNPQDPLPSTLPDQEITKDQDDRARWPPRPMTRIEKCDWGRILDKLLYFQHQIEIRYSSPITCPRSKLSYGRTHPRARKASLEASPAMEIKSLMDRLGSAMGCEVCVMEIGIRVYILRISLCHFLFHPSLQLKIQSARTRIL